MAKFKDFKEAETVYGKIENGKWPNEILFMKVYKVPDFIKSWTNSATGKLTKKVYINRDCVVALDKALNNLKDRNLLDQLKTFDGCFSIRDVRGEPGKPSAHSYGLAIDINAKLNPLNKEPTMTAEFVKCFTDAGWTWGGNFKRKDGMHFSIAWE